MEDLERGAELLPSQSPFQFILSYLKKVGASSLETIPVGRRSGKLSDINAVVAFYREKENPEGIHILAYDYKTSGLVHYNDIAWIFRNIECEATEPLRLPITGYEGFRQFQVIDAKAREEILKAVNVPFDFKGAQRIKAKNQRELAGLILESYNQGKLSKDESLEVYRVLNQENLVAWEDEFHEYLEDYKRHQNIGSVLSSLENLFQKYRIGLRERAKPKALSPTDLDVICYMFLSRQDVGQLVIGT
jgi:hypothetical protein